MKKSLLTLLSLAALSVNAQAEPQNPMAKASAMAWQCAPCHGTNGQEFLEAMPPLAGMPAKQFEEAMIGYREGTRAAIIMDRVARGFNDEEIKAMAAWFEKQPLKQWENTSLNEAYAADKTGGQK
jgi:sulfide dehydrogenase cytochrome subunit